FPRAGALERNRCCAERGARRCHSRSVGGGAAARTPAPARRRSVRADCRTAAGRRGNASVWVGEGEVTVMSNQGKLEIEWISGHGGPGLSEGFVRWGDRALEGWRWPIIELQGSAGGPRLCVMAGVHVNESPGMQAAARLAREIDPGSLHGSVSILPL